MFHILNLKTSETFQRKTPDAAIGFVRDRVEHGEPCIISFVEGGPIRLHAEGVTLFNSAAGPMVVKGTRTVEPGEDGRIQLGPWRYVLESTGVPNEPRPLSDEAAVSIAAHAYGAISDYRAAIGEADRQAWEELEERRRASYVAGVRAIHDNPDITPQEQHAAWMEEKVSEGWTHGDLEDAEAKTHPCLVPYELLPAEQRAKDFIFGLVVRQRLWG